MTAACVSVSVTLSLGLVAARKVRRGNKTAPSLVFKIQVIFLIIYLTESMPLLVACVQRSDRLFDLAFAMIGISAVVFTLTCTSVVYFSGTETSPIRGIGLPRPDWDRGANEIAAKLEQAIKASAAYRDADLRLDQLARLSGVEPSRLSYYFKASLGVISRLPQRPEAPGRLPRLAREVRRLDPRHRAGERLQLQEQLQLAVRQGLRHDAEGIPLEPFPPRDRQRLTAEEATALAGNPVHIGNLGKYVQDFKFWTMVWDSGDKS